MTHKQLMAEITRLDNDAASYGEIVDLNEKCWEFLRTRLDKKQMEQANNNIAELGYTLYDAIFDFPEIKEIS